MYHCKNTQKNLLLIYLNTNLHKYQYITKYYFNLIKLIHHFLLNHMYEFNQTCPYMKLKNLILNFIILHLNIILALTNFNTTPAPSHLNPT